MHWYNGTIAEAVTLSKQRNAIFVVFIEGDNELSAEMAATIDDKDVLKRLADPNNFLAIKLMSGSTNYTHFAQILAGAAAEEAARLKHSKYAELERGYKFVPFAVETSGCWGIEAECFVRDIGRRMRDRGCDSRSGAFLVQRLSVAIQHGNAASIIDSFAPGVSNQFVPVPSLFFIGRNGTPLEVVCAGVQPSNLATRIDRILEEHLKDKPGAPLSTPSDNIKQQTADLLNSEGGSQQPTTARAGSPKIDHSKPETLSEPPKKVQKTHHVEISKSGKEYDVVCDGDVCTRVPRVRLGDPGPSSANVVIHEPSPKIKEPPTPIKPPTATPKQPSATPKQPTEPLKQPTETPKQPVETPKEAALTLKEPVETPKQVTETPKPPTDGGNIDDKIEKAKELIEARRKEKAALEKELEIQKELERRAAGHGVTELKQWQADQELKQIQEERKREKLENNLARQRILEQIAQDRAERKARDQPPPVAQANVSHPPPTAGDGGTRARIQFKLPDGASHTAHFDAAGTLRDVHVYVADNLQLSQSNFSLWTAFPRRELTDPDATLRHLQLTPSAALLVLPRRTPDAVASPLPFASIIAFLAQIFTTFVLEPSQQLYAWLRSRINSDPPAPPPRPPSEPTEVPRGPPAGDLRRHGNIHRLGDEKSPDDDNNTWNGNSTQQM